MLRKSRLVLFVTLLVFAAHQSLAATITRGTKASGGTDFVSGYTISPSEMNTDLNTVYTLVNGNLDADNLATSAVATAEILNGTILDTDVSASADIDGSKINDYSTNDAEQITSTTPGTPDSLTNATDLEEEIAMIRYMLEQVTVGLTAAAYSSSAGTASDTAWVTSPIRTPNLLYNGGFDVLQTLSTTADGDGWTRVNTPTTLAAEALVEAEGHGDGNGINIIDTGDALSGLSQALDGLKADTIYLAQVWTRDDVGTCRIATTGADTNQCADTSDDSGDWQLLKCTFETDSTPTNVVVQLLAVAASDDCIFENAAVYEINTDSTGGPGTIVAHDTSNTADACGGVGGGAIDDLSAAVTVPSPGYIVEVYGAASFDNTSGNAASVEVTMIENGGEVGEDLGISCGNQTADHGSATLVYMNTSPTPGTTYTYQVNCNDIDGGVNHIASEIYVKAYPAGVGP